MLEVETFGDRYPSFRRRPGSPATRCWRPPSTRSHPQETPPGSQCSFRCPGWLRHRDVAAVAVAVLGGMAALHQEQPSRSDIAYEAHRLEVDILGVQSGIQDQLSAAFGGINLEMETYPEASVRPLPTWQELDPRLTLVFLGRAHDSSAIHPRSSRVWLVAGQRCSRGCGMQQSRRATLFFGGTLIVLGRR